MEMLRGLLESHYVKLRSYIAELKRVDREGRFELEVEEGKFTSVYIGFSGLLKGFKHGCRHVISFDGAFLKIIVGGAILSAIGRDRNNQMFPISWAVVLTENEVCRRWFISRLFEELQIVDGLGWTFISDQQKVRT